MSKVLSVATAKLTADQLEDTDHFRYPRVDYIELQRLLDAETMDYSTYDREFIGNRLRRMETHLRSDVYLATLGWLRSRDYPLVFTWSERAGIPFSAYKRFLGPDNRFVTMFQCWSKRQERTLTRLDLFSAMDSIIVHCESMKRNLIRLGVEEEKIRVIYYSIDQSFFSPMPGNEPQKSLIMSIGESRSRNYAALFRAVDRLPINVEVAASGHWYAREKANNISSSIPENISITRNLPQREIRNLYARAQFVVLPIRNLVYSAGATATLEAGSMARAVIAFRSQGIVDYIVDGETGILVDPGDVASMREAIQYLLANPGEAKRMGDNARQRIIDELNLETYVCHLANLLAANLPQSA